jgi:hypothetical protein
MSNLLTLEKPQIINEPKRNEPFQSLRLSMRDLLLKEVAENIVSEQPEIAALAERIRSESPIYPMSKHEAFIRVVGVDAGSQILPLASRRYAVISALAYSLPSGSRFFLQPEVMMISNASSSKMFEATINLRREAKLYETAIQFLEQTPETELLLVDGPLCFSDWWKLSGGQKDRQRLIEGVNKLLKICRDCDVVVAGVVKRPSARYFIYHMKMQADTGLPDSSLLLQTLHPGERTDIFSPRAAMQQANRSSDFMDALQMPVYSFYGRMTREWSIPPIRVDLPAHSLASLDDVADYCYASSMFSGIPLPILKADEAVKVTRSFVAEVYGEILSKVSRSSGEVRGLAPYWGEGRWMGV